VAVGPLLQVLERAGQRVGGAAAHLALILDRSQVRAEIDEARQLVRLPLRGLVVGVLRVVAIALAGADLEDAAVSGGGVEMNDAGHA